VFIEAKLQSNHHHKHPVFLQARCPSCHPTNSVKALKGVIKAVKAKHIHRYYAIKQPLHAAGNTSLFKVSKQETKVSYCGDVLRKSSCIEKEITEGCANGNGSRG